MLHDDIFTAEITALKIALEDAVSKARKLADHDIQAFGEVFLRVELAHRRMQPALERHQHKVKNRHKMALLNDLIMLRRR